MLSKARADTNQVNPKGDERMVRRAWEEWDETITAVRLLLAVPEAWSAHFNAGMRTMLTPAERLAIPGEWQRTRWTGRDSTLEVIGVGDYHDRVYGRVRVEEVMPQLRAISGDEDVTTIIAIAEFLCLTLLAASQRERWGGLLILYVTANTRSDG